MWNYPMKKAIKIMETYFIVLWFQRRHQLNNSVRREDDMHDFCSMPDWQKNNLTLLHRLLSLY
jgi:hypothetical protein